MSKKEDLQKRKAEAEQIIADGAVLDEYQAYLPETQEDEALAFHYFMRDTILEFKKLRKQKGITQAVLAARMGTQQTAISRFESYNGVPSLPFLNKYAMALGVNLNSLGLGGITLNIPDEIYTLARQVYGNDPMIIKNCLLEAIRVEVKSRFEYKNKMMEAFSSSELNSSVEWNDEAFMGQVTP